jgi:hypothetical protein
MARETEEVAADLERYLKDRLAFLSRLTAQVADQERLLQLTQRQKESLNNVMLSHFERQSRSGLRHQILFLVIAFLLGFVVNWLSTPALDLLSRLPR